MIIIIEHPVCNVITGVENLTKLSEQNGQKIVKPTFYSKIVLKIGNCKKAGRNKQAGGNFFLKPNKQAGRE